MSNDLAQSRVGTVLCERYRLERIIGAGGMAVVYAGSHVRNRQRFAIKMLHPEASIDGEIRARFLREGYVANGVRHRGAVMVIDDGAAEDGSAFLVMELLEGLTVEQAWERQGGRLDPRLVLAIADQLLETLAVAHGVGIVHRDIKPANLFLTLEAVVKVLDFGIARLRDGGASATQTGTMLGTPAFMAPEQASGRTSEIDERTDLWAVGATMFTLLSGQTVHTGESGREVLMRAMMHPARSLATAAPESLPAMLTLVDRALAFDKAQRWATAAAMRAALRDLHQAEYGGPVSEAPIRALFAAPAISATLVHADVERRLSQPPLRGPGARTDLAPSVRGSGARSPSYVPSVRTVGSKPAPPSRAGVAGLAVAGALVAGAGIAFFLRSAPRPEPIAPATPATVASGGVTEPRGSSTAAPSRSDHPLDPPGPSAHEDVDAATAAATAGPIAKNVHATPSATSWAGAGHTNPGAAPGASGGGKTAATATAPAAAADPLSMPIK